jgi:hypothetical protein
MNLRQSLAIGATLILGMGLGGVFSWQPSFAQQKVEQMTVGRYQVAAYGRDWTNAGMVVIDTATGQCWIKLGQLSELNDKWKEVSSPAVRRSK